MYNHVTVALVKTQNLFITLVSSLVSAQSTLHLLQRCVLQVLERHLHGVMSHVLSWAWLISLSVKLL